MQKANRRLPDFPPSQKDEDCRYDGAVIRRPMLLLVPVLLCQFVLLQAQGGWFMSSFWDKVTGNSLGGDIQTALSCLSAAGGLALLALHAHARTPLLSDRNRDRAVRWCAAWAVLGQLIVCLKSWASALDKPCALLSAGQSLSLVWNEVWERLAQLPTIAVMNSLALCLWAALLLRPQWACRLWPVLLPLLCLMLQAPVLRRVLLSCFP